MPSHVNAQNMMRTQLSLAESAEMSDVGTWNLFGANLRELTPPRLPSIIDVVLVLGFSFDAPIETEVTFSAEVTATTPSGQEVSALRLSSTFHRGEFSSLYPWRSTVVFEEPGVWTFRLSVPDLEPAVAHLRVKEH